ncbi:MAG: polysaccharide deacetylase family protein [Candidatus Omnitrophota bacterium]|nr:polysaccharide deacetylase family protein [Candidatus Omnitrophota bacterium]
MEIKSAFKNIQKDLLCNLGVPKSMLRFMRFSGQPALLIFTYHRVCRSLDDYGYLNIPVNIFEQHMKFLKDNFKTVAMADALEEFHNNRAEGIYAAVNFDDGYMDNYLQAYPVLKRYGIPATIFLTTDFIGREHAFWWDKVFNMLYLSDAGELKIDIDKKRLAFRLGGIFEREKAGNRINSILAAKDQQSIESFIKKFENKFSRSEKPRTSMMLGWDEIKAMHKHGISFGSHTKSHRNLCLLRDQDLAEELAGSKKDIEKMLGVEIAEFAYPFGILDQRVKAFVKEAGYKYARTTSKGFNYKNTDRYMLSAIGTGSFLKADHLALRIMSCFLNR